MQQNPITLETLAALAGLNERHFVYKYAEQAYNFCHSAVDAIRQNPDDYPELNRQSYSSRLEWVQKGIENGFVPAELGMKLRGFVPKRAYFFGPYPLSDDSPNTINYSFIGPGRIGSGGGHATAVKHEVTRLLGMGYDIILDETHGGEKIPIHPIAKQHIAAEIDAYNSRLKK